MPAVIRQTNNIQPDCARQARDGLDSIAISPNLIEPETRAIYSIQDRKALELYVWLRGSRRRKIDMGPGYYPDHSYSNTRARARRNFSSEVAHDCRTSSAESPRFKRSKLSVLTSKWE